ncbi:hypothetical protein BGZ74_003491 [Mortierella antarctica]|nr:hypothetical protein BGZ74_003491 [Mortierella antarctica]
MSKVMHTRPRVVWTIAVALLILSTAAAVTSSEDNILLHTTSTEEAIAYDPLENIADQLMVPVAAGVPPLPLSTDQDSIQTLQMKEQRYIQRIETERVEKQGSLYVELTPDELRTRGEGTAGNVRFAGEPLPWDGVEEENGLWDEYFVQGSYLPWGEEFRYEAILEGSDQDETSSSKGTDGQSTCQCEKSRVASSSSKQASFSAMQADHDDGADIADEQSSRLEIEMLPAMDEVTRDLKVEETGEAIETLDPNVKNNVKEIVEPQIWDADGLSQKMQGRVDQGAREYFQQEEVPSIKAINQAHVSDKTEERPELDQIDFMSHEAEVDWLDEQDKMFKSWRHRQHHQANKHVDAEWDSNSIDEEQPDGNEPPADAPKTPEEMFNDPQWHRKHGGLNPGHFHNQNAQKSSSNVSRREKKDIDEDGTVFPDAHSDRLYSKIVYPSISNNTDSALGYVSYNRQGDRIMDFSMVGWNEGNTDLPDPKSQVPIVMRLVPRPGSDSNTDTGDDTDRIQAAIDKVTEITSASVSTTSVVPTGALVLARGVYKITKPLKIQGSGILFRGDPAGGSRIVCNWDPAGPRYAIEVMGDDDEMMDETRTPIMSEYTPVGSFFLALDPSYFEDTGLAVGDKVVLTRIGNDRWVKDIGMDNFGSNKKGVKPWRKMSGHMYRTIKSLNAQTGIVQLDAPVPISIMRKYGGGWVTKYEDNKLRAVGIQFLDMVFPRNIGRTTNDMLDKKGRGSQDYRFAHEIFANYAMRLDNVQHVYVSHITSAFFHNFVSVGSNAHHLTFDSVVHSYPDDMLSGQSAFQLSGQLVLIKNSLSQGSFHFFVDISHVMGPNVVHRAQAINVAKPHQPMPTDFAPGEVGPHAKFCTGLLFDQVVTDGAIMIVNRGSMGTGQGLTGANSVVWNSRAREGILTHRARGFQNFVIGSEDYDAEDRMSWSLHGWKEHLGAEVLPGSLYLRQLADRMSRLARGWIA